MKGRGKSVKLVSAEATTARQPLGSKQLVIGVDGGGTKTRAIVVDERERVLGEGLAGPSNPLRVGVGAAVSAVREAVDRACAAARVSRLDVVSAEVGLAGARRADLRKRMREELLSLGIGTLEVVSDSDIALSGATDGSRVSSSSPGRVRSAAAATRAGVTRARAAGGRSSATRGAAHGLRGAGCKRRPKRRTGAAVKRL